MSKVFRLLGAAVSRTTRGGKLAILIYHRVLAAPDSLLPGEPDERAFGWQMETLARHFRVLPLWEAIELLAAGGLPSRAACITFDDGYADNFSIALPILRRVGLPATFFIATGFVGGGRMWNDSIIEAIRVAEPGTLDLSSIGLGVYVLGDAPSRRRAIDDVLARVKYRPPAERDEVAAKVVAAGGKRLRGDLMMTAEQVAGLARNGMEIGAHTVSHSLLAKLSDAEARREIRDGRSALEQMTGRAVRLFAYPNGKPDRDYTRRDVELIRQLGFCGAVSTAWGVGTPHSDRFQLPRFTPWDRTPKRFVLRLLRNYTVGGAECA